MVADGVKEAGRMFTRDSLAALYGERRGNHFSRFRGFHPVLKK
jgi:hypothetical protein